MFSSLFRRLGLIPMQNRAARRRSQPRRLGLERLEGREVPATVYGLTTGNTLLRFDSASPGTIQATTAITGLGANEQVVGIDFRPRTGQLIASTVVDASAANSIIRTYSIDPTSGAATLIGATAAALAGAGDVDTAYDFNPTVDRIRYVNENNENARLNPNNGALAGNDTDLTFVAPAVGPIVGEAYDRNFDRQSAALPTTLYGIDRGSNMLVIQGGINGTPSPNLGVITAVGPLGVALGAGTEAGFDIAASTSGGQGTALAALTVGGVTGLYSINLSTGAATLIGNIGNGATELASLAIVPDGVVAVGSGLGANGDARLLDPTSGAIRVAVVPFAGFQGGVRVATGDVTRDGVPDLIVSADAPQGHVKVFDGVTGAQLPGLIGSFFAFEGFSGTVNVTAGDVNGDGFADVIVAANGVSGHVKAFSGADGSLLASFLSFDGFTGNVTVAAADFDNDGDDEIVVAAASNGHVKVFNADGTPFVAPGFVSSFFAFDGFPGNVNVAAGDVNGDGRADIVVSSGAGTRGHVKAFSGIDGSLIASFFAYPPTFTGGAFVGVSDFNRDGRYEIAVTPGLGTQADVVFFNLVGTPLGSFPAFANFQGGATVGGTRF